MYRTLPSELDSVSGELLGNPTVSPTDPGVGIESTVAEGSFPAARRIDIASAILWVYPIIFFLSDWALTVSVPYGLILHGMLLAALAVHYVFLAQRLHEGSLLLVLGLVPLARLISVIFTLFALPRDLMPLLAAMPLLAVLLVVGVVALLDSRPTSDSHSSTTQPDQSYQRDSALGHAVPIKGRALFMVTAIRRFAARNLTQVAIGASGIAIGVLIIAVYHGLGVDKLGLVGNLSSAMSLAVGSVPTPLFLLGLAVLAVVEEIVFRGLILSGACNVMGQGGIVFAALIWTATSMSFISPLYMLVTIAVALVWGMAAEWGGSIIGVVIAHILANLVVGIWPYVGAQFMPMLTVAWPWLALVSTLLGAAGIIRVARR